MTSYNYGSKRPNSPLVIGIICVIFAALALLGLLVSLTLSDAPGAREVMAVYDKDAFLSLWNPIGTAIGAIAGVVLLFGGIGLIKYTAWGRKLALYYGVYSIIMGIVNGIILFAVAIPAFKEAFIMREIVSATELSGVFSTLLSVAFGVILLYFMTRPGVVAYLDKSMDIADVYD